MNKNTNTYNGTDLDLLARNAYRTLIGELRNEKFDVQGNSFSHVYGTDLVPFNKYMNSTNLVVSCLDGEDFQFTDANSKINDIIEISRKLKSFNVNIIECLANGPYKKPIFMHSGKLNNMAELKQRWYDHFIALRNRKGQNDEHKQISLNDMVPEYTVITGQNLPMRCRFNLVVLPYSHNFDKKDIEALVKGEHKIYTPAEQIGRYVSSLFK